ncbi:MAG: hypothetical protein WD603_01565 [Patescibacteria group bacterium]
MRDMKAEHGLGDPKYWPELPSITVPGDPDATPWPKDPDADVGAVIDSWTKAAVFVVCRPAYGPFPSFYVGWRSSGGSMHRLSIPVEVDRFGAFAMRIGHEDVTFFVIPLDPATRIHWGLQGVYDIDGPDPELIDAPLY